MTAVIARYFWSLNARAQKETGRALRDPQHRKFLAQTITLLSLCDNPREAFRAIPKGIFIDHWPVIKRKWQRSGHAQSFLHWWDSIHQTLVSAQGAIAFSGQSAYLKRIGEQVKFARLGKEWSQIDLSRRANVKQRLISEVESGKANITLGTLLKIANVLGIKRIELGL